MPNELVSTLPKDGGRLRLHTAETLNLCSALFRCTHARTVHACSASMYLLHSTIDSKIQFQRFMKFEQKLWKSFFSTHLLETLKAILGLIDITIDF